MGSIVHRSVPTNLKWFPNCSHAHALFQDRFKDVQVGSSGSVHCTSSHQTFTHMAVCRLRDLKSELVKDLYTVQKAVTKSPQTKTKPKAKTTQTKHKKQQHKTNKPNDDVTGASSWVNYYKR